MLIWRSNDRCPKCIFTKKKKTTARYKSGKSGAENMQGTGDQAQAPWYKLDINFKILFVDLIWRNAELVILLATYVSSENNSRLACSSLSSFFDSSTLLSAICGLSCASSWQIWSPSGLLIPRLLYKVCNAPLSAPRTSSNSMARGTLSAKRLYATMSWTFHTIRT